MTIIKICSFYRVYMVNKQIGKAKCLYLILRGVFTISHPMSFAFSLNDSLFLSAAKAFKKLDILIDCFSLSKYLTFMPVT